MLSRAIEAVGPSTVTSVSAKLGVSNLEVFRSAVSAGMTSEQAVWSTPPGRSMARLGSKSLKLTQSVRFLY